MCVSVCLCVCIHSYSAVCIYSESGAYVIYFISRSVSALSLTIVYLNTEYIHFLFFTLVKKGEQTVEFLHVSSTCAHRQEGKIVLYSLWCHHTYR